MLINPDQRLISNGLDYLTKSIEKNTEDDFEESGRKSLQIWRELEGRISCLCRVN